MSANQGKLREIVGKVEEEEPEGEAVVGPSVEATIHSSGITPSLFSFLLFLIYAYTYTYFFLNTSLLHISLLGFSFFSWQISLPTRRYLDLKLRKRRTWTLCTAGSKWGVSCSSRGGGMGASVRSEFILSSLFLVSMWLSTSFLHSYPCTFSSCRGWIYWKRWAPYGRKPRN